ncbi:hypothetical protein L218DRAFT_1021737 [Marasmius fiardii PR-910]|nr:hypothetical protein L218DRAFT_1021737 [Marasmius fiardii PR-910]
MSWPNEALTVKSRWPLIWLLSTICILSSTCPPAFPSLDTSLPNIEDPDRWWIYPFSLLSIIPRKYEIRDGGRWKRFLGDRWSLYDCSTPRLHWCLADSSRGCRLSSYARVLKLR